MINPISGNLTKAQIKYFKTLLLTKEAEIRRDLQALSGGHFASPTDATPDCDDLVSRDRDEWIFLNHNHIDQMLLREIRGALQSIQEGVYGRCLECKLTISHKRLESIPWASFCMACQESLAAPA